MCCTLDFLKPHQPITHDLVSYQKKKDSILSANKNEGLTRQQVRDKYNQRKVNRNALKLAGSMFGPMVGPVPPEVVDETTHEKMSLILKRKKLLQIIPLTLKKFLQDSSKLLMTYWLNSISQ